MFAWGWRSFVVNTSLMRSLSSLKMTAVFAYAYQQHRTHSITSHHITSHHITSHHITSHHITSHHITSHHITSHLISSHLITSHHITSHHITSHHITSHHITSHHITSHHITSHHITSQCTREATPWACQVLPLHTFHLKIFMQTLKFSYSPLRAYQIYPSQNTVKQRNLTRHFLKKSDSEHAANM